MMVSLYDYLPALAEENVTITTYFPAPFGVYKNLRLFPSVQPVCDSGQRGLMYYNDSDNTVYVCRGQSPGDWMLAGSGFWAASGNDIYNTNPGVVNIGTSTFPPLNGPQKFLNVKGYGSNASLMVAEGHVGVNVLNLDSGDYDFTIGSPSQLNTYLDIRSGEEGALCFSRGNLNPPAAKVYFNHTTHKLIFQTAGIDRLALDTDGNFGIGTTNPAEKLDIRGGNATVEAGYSWLVGSDRRLKTGITQIDEGLAKTCALQGVYYDTLEDRASRGKRGKHVGFIAQDTEKVIPEVVTTDARGYKSINYDGIIPFLVEAIKTQQSEIESIEADIDALKRTVFERKKTE